MSIITYQPTTEFAPKHCVGLSDYTKDDIYRVLKLALGLKQRQKHGIAHKHLEGKVLAMIFAKRSTRTRVSFQTGIFQLGGTGLFLSSDDLQLGRGETIGDTAKVLSSMCDGIMIRTFDHSDVLELAANSSVPVINGLTDLLHPCQALADVLTFFEVKGDFAGKKLAYVGDGNNVAHSLLIACAKIGLNISIGCPEAHMPDKAIVKQAMEAAEKTGARIKITNDPKKAVEGADAVYTDVWASMGEEAEAEEKHSILKQYQVNSELMACANEKAVFMHCLPAHREEEVTGEVMDGPASVVFEQAENRLHVQKALMTLLMG